MEEVGVWRKCGFIVVFVSCLLCQASADTESEIFDAKPGGEVHEYVKQTNGLAFKFIYAAQGGTNEQWTAQVEDVDGGSVRFSVRRPGGTSYLFFQQFRLEVAGAETLDAGAMADESSNLNPGEYTVGKNYIEHVDGKFDAHLASVYILVKKTKREL